MDGIDEKESSYFAKLQGKEVSLSKVSNGKERFYRGVVTNVFDDKLILNDRKIGEIPLSFDSLSVLEVFDGNQ